MHIKQYKLSIKGNHFGQLCWELNKRIEILLGMVKVFSMHNVCICQSKKTTKSTYLKISSLGSFLFINA